VKNDSSVVLVMSRHVRSAVAAVLLCLLWAMASTRAHSQVVNSTQNPLQLALLHWYSANLVPTQFGVAYYPAGLAFDGANIWVATNNSVYKLRANDGFLLGTFALVGHLQALPLMAPISG